MKLDQTLFDKLLTEAAASPRKRSHLNLHTKYDEPVQRLCIGLQRGTYVRPHHHPAANKWELILPLSGETDLLIFDADSTLLERLELIPGGACTGIEMQPGQWHSLFPRTESAVIMEVKEGPYTPAQPTDFAHWAPAEGEDNVSDFLAWMENAQPGEKYHAN